MYEGWLTFGACGTRGRAVTKVVIVVTKRGEIRFFSIERVAKMDLSNDGRLKDNELLYT